MSLLLLKNGKVVDPVTQTEEVKDLLIDQGTIVQMGPTLSAPDAKVLDCTGFVVAPGLMDAHVHFRDPGYTEKEDILTGAAAAARGGFTTVVCMANTRPVVDNPQILAEIQKKARATNVQILQASAITKGLKGIIRLRVLFMIRGLLAKPAIYCFWSRCFRYSR